MTKPHIISLYDFTGEMLRPWMARGYTCHALDIQHPHGPSIDPQDIDRDSGGKIIKHRWDRAMPVWKTVDLIHHMCCGQRVGMVFGFPVCTDLAASGARHWAGKLERDPTCQVMAAQWAREVSEIAEALYAPYMIENPNGALTKLWRKWDFSFDPCDYGLYIPERDKVHPRWPEHIPPRDAYTKRTNLWTSRDFIMPQAAPVKPLMREYTKADGTVTRGSWQWGKLGGKSQRTKNIRSATPRGFAIAVCNANRKAIKQQQQRTAA